MCRRMSFVVLRRGTILYLPEQDSHELISEHYRKFTGSYPELQDKGDAPDYASVELHPLPGNKASERPTKDWIFSWDNYTPKWSHEREYEHAVREAAQIRYDVEEEAEHLKIGDEIVPNMGVYMRKHGCNVMMVAFHSLSCTRLYPADGVTPRVEYNNNICVRDSHTTEVRGTIYSYEGVPQAFGPDESWMTHMTKLFHRRGTYNLVEFLELLKRKLLG